MKSCEEMVQSLLLRRERYEIERKKRRKRAVGFSASALCCGLALGFLFLLPELRDNSATALLVSSPAPTDNGGSDTGEQLIPDGPQKDLIEPDGGNDAEIGEPEPDGPVTDAAEPGGGALQPGEQITIGSAYSSEETMFYWWKNRVNMSGRLYWALEDDPDGEFAVTAVYRPATANITSFVYEGKTLAEWGIGAVEAMLLPDKMVQLLKMGDSLKYGTALYETGTPDGEKWDKGWYEDRIAFFGEELLDRYLVDGEFLREELEQDLENYDNSAEIEAEEAYGRAFAAYLETVLPEAVQKLTALGIPCERTPDRNDRLLLTVTAAELENLPLDDLKNWYFGLAEAE